MERAALQDQYSQPHLHPLRPASGLNGVDERFEPIAIVEANGSAARVARQRFRRGTGDPAFHRHDHSHQFGGNAQPFVARPARPVRDFAQPEERIFFQAFRMAFERGAFAVRPGSRASCGQSLSLSADAEKPDARLKEIKSIAAREAIFIMGVENLPCNSSGGQEHPSLNQCKFANRRKAGSRR